MKPRPLLFALEELALGVMEYPDTNAQKENPRIVEYQRVLAPGVADDEISWCSSFAAFCTKSANYSIIGVTPAARSWMEWGKPAPAHVGAIVVLWRVSPKSWQGHVGFLLDWSRDVLYILGGNQGNRVSVATFPKHQILGYREPVEGW